MHNKNMMQQVNDLFDQIIEKHGELQKLSLVKIPLKMSLHRENTTTEVTFKYEFLGDFGTTTCDLDGTLVLLGFLLKRIESDLALLKSFVVFTNENHLRVQFATRLNCPAPFSVSGKYETMVHLMVGVRYGDNQLCSFDVESRVKYDMLKRAAKEAAQDPAKFRVDTDDEVPDLIDADVPSITKK